ncbi:alpha/beta fold hydrolase [Actinoplanes derwentensis]|nr:alpha/beta fold hydrolase [Actinoplanes derwentensis]
MAVLVAVTGSAVPVRAAPPAAVTWGSCPPARPAGFECATVPVPIDYRRPEGRSIGIAMVRHPATDPVKRIGSLFLNPGGPGGSGLNMAVSIAGRAASDPLVARLAESFDIIGFDPRGVGESAPIECWDAAETDRRFVAADATPGPETAAFARAVRDGRDFAAACAAKNDELLPFIGTEYVARDLDRLRVAVGDSKLTYFGASYGTYIGTVYANLFPQRSRALVLDGAYDPVRYTTGAYAQDAPQNTAVDRAADRFFAWCADPAAQCPFGAGDPAAAFDRLVARLDREPVTRTVTNPQTGSVTTYVTDGYLLLYQLMLKLNGGRAAYRTIAGSLAQADQGGGPYLESRVGPYSANVAVECNDRWFPRSLDDLRRGLRTVAAASGRFGPALAYGPPGYDQSHGAVCTQWTAPRLSRFTGSFTAAGAPPILVAGNTGDPDVPYQDAVALAATLDSGHLLTYRANRHVAFLSSRCASAVMVDYLIGTALPSDGVVCDDEPATPAPAA